VFASGAILDGVRFVSDEAIAAPAAVADCDLAVVRDPQPAALRAAFDALGPGGYLYGEWYSPLAGGPPGVRRRLEEVGFGEIRCYWPWPWPDRAPPQFWLPLEAPQALDYFLATRPRPRTFRLRITITVLRVLWRLALRTRMLVPVCTTARKPAEAAGANAASTRGSGTRSDILDALRTQWRDWQHENTPDHLTWLLLTGGLHSSNKVVGLVFDDSSTSPRLVVKFARTDDSADALEREASTLRSVHRSRPGGAVGVPRPLFLRRHPGGTALGETEIEGQPLSKLLRLENFEHFALRLTDWLADLALPAVPTARETWWERLVELPLGEFERSFAPVLDPRLLEETRLVLGSLGGLPLVVEQRDCAPWNILVDNSGRVGIVDWESAEAQGLPARDLVYYLTYSTFFVDGALATGAVRRSYRASLDRSAFTGRVAGECVDRYLTRLGLDRANLPPLRVLTWLLHTRSDYRRLVGDPGRPEPDDLRHSLFLALWEEELRAQRLTER
jgi:hypothetical protein